MDYISLTAHVINSSEVGLEVFSSRNLLLAHKILGFFLSSDTKRGSFQLPKINQRHHDACRVFVSP